MKRLIRLELQRISLRAHLISLLIANIIVLLLCVFVSVFLMLLGNFMIEAGLPKITLTTVSLAVMLVRAVLLVWQGVLIAKIIIEEYRNKTMGLLYTYPVGRKMLVFAKLILISGLLLFFYAISSIFQHLAIFLISRKLDFVSYSPENIAIQLVTIVSTIFLGFVPLAVGMVNKSSIATVLASVIIAAFFSNSQGGTAGLLSIPVIAILLGMIGLVVLGITIRKIFISDLPM